MSRGRWAFPLFFTCETTSGLGLPNTRATWTLWRRVQWRVSCVPGALDELGEAGRAAVASWVKEGFLALIFISYRYLLERCRQDGHRLFLQMNCDTSRGSTQKIENGIFWFPSLEILRSWLDYILSNLLWRQRWHSAGGWVVFNGL